MRLLPLSLSAVGVAAAFLITLPAYANSTGMTGRSGKQGGQTCMSGCHGDAANHPSDLAPTVTLEGPTTLSAGATGNYSLVITGGPAVNAGMNVAVSNSSAVLNKVGTDLKVMNGELTHTAPKTFSSGEARFDFTMVAPPSAGTVTIYASGNSVNGDHNFTGDHSTPTTLDVQVTASTTDGGTGNPDAGTGSTDPGTDNPNGATADSGGCAAAGGAPVALLLAVVAARMRRRKA
jgi:uncharacterized protein (TIGR03382 family)